MVVDITEIKLILCLFIAVNCQRTCTISQLQIKQIKVHLKFSFLVLAFKKAN